MSIASPTRNILIAVCRFAFPVSALALVLTGCASEPIQGNAAFGDGAVYSGWLDDEIPSGAGKLSYPGGIAIQGQFSGRLCRNCTITFADGSHARIGAEGMMTTNPMSARFKELWCASGTRITQPAVHPGSTQRLSGFTRELDVTDATVQWPDGTQWKGALRKGIPSGPGELLVPIPAAALARTDTRQRQVVLVTLPASKPQAGKTTPPMFLSRASTAPTTTVTVHARKLSGTFTTSVPVCELPGIIANADGTGDRLAISSLPAPQPGYVGFQLDGKPHGRGYAVLTTGERYLGDFAEGRPTGFATFLARNGAVYEGDMVDGTFEGIGSIYMPPVAAFPVSQHGRFLAGQAEGWHLIRGPGQGKQLGDPQRVARFDKGKEVESHSIVGASACTLLGLPRDTVGGSNNAMPVTRFLGAGQACNGQSKEPGVLVATDGGYLLREAVIDPSGESRKVTSGQLIALEGAVPSRTRFFSGRISAERFDGRLEAIDQGKLHTVFQGQYVGGRPFGKGQCQSGDNPAQLEACEYSAQGARIDRAHVARVAAIAAAESRAACDRETGAVSKAGSEVQALVKEANESYQYGVEVARGYARGALCGNRPCSPERATAPLASDIGKLSSRLASLDGERSRNEATLRNNHCASNADVARVGAQWRSLAQGGQQALNNLVQAQSGLARAVSSAGRQRSADLEAEYQSRSAGMRSVLNAIQSAGAQSVISLQQSAPVVIAPTPRPVPRAEATPPRIQLASGTAAPDRTTPRLTPTTPSRPLPSGTAQTPSPRPPSGQNARACVSAVVNEKGAVFTNNCREMVFVIFCGEMKYSKERCGEGPRGGYYTSSLNIAPGAEAIGQVKRSLRYGACTGRISFGNDGHFRDQPNGDYVCLKR